MSYIASNNLSRHYGTGNATVTAVEDINLSIELGEFVAIMGESGPENPRCCPSWAP